MTKLIIWLMMLVMMLTAGCGDSSSDNKPSKGTANSLSDDAQDCANVVKILLDQRLHYNNDAAENLTKKSVVSIRGNSFPINFDRYSKAALKENLRRHFIHCSRLDERRLSYANADEIASAFAELIKTSKYEVTPSGKTVELDGGEYQELNLHLEYPDIDAINQKALENLSAALKSNFESGSVDPDKIIADRDRYGFEKLDRLLEYGVNIDRTQHAALDNAIRDSYMSALNDANNLPYKTFDGKINIARVEKKGIVNYIFWDKNESLLALNIDLWASLFPPNVHAALDSGLQDALKIAVRDVRLGGSNAMDVSIFVNNRSDDDIVLKYCVCDAYDQSLGWQWQSPNNEFIPLEHQEFVLAKGTSKTVDWKLQAGSATGEPFMFRVDVSSRDFNGDIYVPLNIGR